MNSMLYSKGKTMKSLLLSRKKSFILYLFGCFLPVIDTLLRNIATALLIGSIEKGDIDYFLRIVLLSLAFAVLGFFLFLISRFLRIKFMRDIILEVRLKAFDKILAYSIQQFSSKSKDQYVSHLINDVQLFEQNFFFKLINVVFLGGWYLFSLVILAWLDWLFALSLLAISILVFFIIRIFEKKTIGLQASVSQANEDYTLNIANTFNGLEIIKLNRIEDRFLLDSLEKVNQTELRKFRYTVFTESQKSLSNFLGYFIFVGIIVYAINSILQGASFTETALMIQLANGIIWPVAQILPIFNELKAASNIYDKITFKDSVPNLITPLDNRSTHQPSQPYSFSNCIQAKNLSFEYYDKTVLNHVSFSIEKGKKYLIKGASGEGKSTLLKLLSMTLDSYNGELFLDQTPYKKIDPLDFYNHMSMIYQDVFLFEDTIANNITLYKNMDHDHILNSAYLAGMNDFLNALPDGINTRLEENGKNLSGGQRQRISIARAIAKKSDILFVDEGTSSLDVVTARNIENTLLDLDCTLIAISHRYYPEISERYDSVLYIREGQVLEYDAKDYFSREVIAI